MSAVSSVATRLRLLVRLALWTACGLGAGLLIAVAAPLALGHRPLTVLSGSMEPAIATGDVIVVKPIRPAEARVGNVVTYRDAQGKSITHRVRRVRAARDGKFEFITKGDASNATERWAMAADGELGRTVYRIPLMGHALSHTRSRPGRLLLVVLPLALLAAVELVAIWRPRAEVTREATA